MNATNMHYSNVLSIFKIEWDTYEDLKKDKNTDATVKNDNENDCKLIKWVSIFTDCISRAYVSGGTFVYVLRE